MSYFSADCNSCACCTCRCRSSIYSHTALYAITIMTQVSPSSKKVDEFLLTLSQMSQDRLRDDQKRQRDLQRDIDGLRRSSSPFSPRHNSKDSPRHDHGITELKFNRSARQIFQDKWRDVAPELPKRPQEEDGPALPTRPKPQAPQKPAKPPKMPQRPLTVETIDRFENIEIIQPIARPSGKSSLSQSQISVPQYVASQPAKPSKPGRITLFSEMQTEIQGGTRVFASSGTKKPLIPSKPKELQKENSTTLLASSTSLSGSSVTAKPMKPTKPFIALKTTTLGKPDAAEPSKTEKPNFKSFQDKDTQELHNQILRLSPTKGITKEKTKATVTVEATKSFGALRPVKPAKPATLEVPEALSALAKLKAAKAAPLKPQKKFEAVKSDEKKEIESASSRSSLEPSLRKVPGPAQNSKISSQYSSSGQSRASGPELTQAKPDFHAKLSSILRASTEPAMATPSPVSAPAPIRRTQSTRSSEPQKLSHPNKSRAKGPKRKLPKLLNKDKDNVKSKSSVAGSSFAPKIGGGAGANSGNTEPGPEIRQSLQSSNPVSLKPVKRPPPIKGKKPNLDIKPKRIVSGELFL